MKIYTTYSSSETKKIGSELARRVLEVRRRTLDVRHGALVLRQAQDKCALIFALTGDLGSGKTTFAQGFLRGLGVMKKVNSPTFVLMKRFMIRNKRFANAYHIDTYRLKKPKELLDLGLREVLDDPKNIVLIEWAEKLKRYLPKDTVWVRFEHKKETERKLIVFK